MSIELNEYEIKTQKPPLSPTVGVYCGYIIRFNEPDTNGIIMNKDAINVKDFEQMKVTGVIMDYEIDNDGVKIMKKFDLRSANEHNYQF